jgi:predicted dehydrogenase
MTAAADRPLEVGIVGAGAIARAYADVFRGCREGRVVGVADVDANAAKALASTFECDAYASHEALLAARGLDAVIVCTPPATHAPIACTFLSAGVPVLCEKPLAVDLASATAMLDTAARHGVLLTMAAKFRFVDDIIAARNILNSGILGEVVLLENAFTSRVDMSRRWNSNPALSGGGVLIDNGTHSVDIVRYLLGPIGDVLAVEGKRPQGLAVEDTARIFLHSSEGVMGSIDLSWSIDKSLEHFLWIYGSKGEIRVGWRKSSFRQVASGDWVEFGQGYQKIASMRGAVVNFLRAVRGREELVITSEDALASVGVIESAYRSLRSSHWVPVGDLPPREVAIEHGAA